MKKRITYAISQSVRPHLCMVISVPPDSTLLEVVGRWCFITIHSAWIWIRCPTPLQSQSPSPTPNPHPHPHPHPYPNPNPNPWMCPYPGARMALSFINLSGIQHNSIWHQVGHSASAAVRISSGQKTEASTRHSAFTIQQPTSSIRHPAHLH